MNEAYKMQLESLRNELVLVLEDLERSITVAYNSFKNTYGPDHPTLIRLESYYPALQKQRDYVRQLNDLIESNNPDNYAVVSAICAISDYIKADAKCLLHFIQNKEELLPDNAVFH